MFKTPHRDTSDANQAKDLLPNIAEDVSTKSVHAGEARQKLGDSITDPIFCASTYTFENTQSIIDFIKESQPREEYGRYGNPGERIVERKLAELEGGGRKPSFIRVEWLPLSAC